MKTKAYFTKFFLFLGLFLSTNAEAQLNTQNLDKVQFGMKPEEAEKILGKPDKKSAAQWIYGDEKNPVLLLEWNKKLSRAQLYSSIPKIPENLPLQELQQVQNGDAVKPTKLVADPATGRIWEASPQGTAVSFVIQAPWKARIAGKTFPKIFGTVKKEGNE